MRRAAGSTRPWVGAGAIALVLALVAPAPTAVAVVAAPAAPTAAVVLRAGPAVDDMTIQWKPGVGGGAVGAWKYDVSADGGAYSLVKAIKNVAGTTTMTGTVSCAAPVTCAFHVYAFNTGGTVPSNVATRGWSVPAAPTITAVDPGPGAGKMFVSWTLPTDTGGAALATMTYLVRPLSGGAFTGPFSMVAKPANKDDSLTCPDAATTGGCEFKLSVTNSVGGGDGGQWGAGGPGGRGGGGSFAIWSYSSNVTVDSVSSITSGNGGDGGDGGDGAVGQVGAAGGAGGSGGRGGTGGGGAVGSTAGTVSVGTGGVIVPNAVTQIVIGTAGTPGNGAGPGTAAPQLSADENAPVVLSRQMKDNDNDGKIDQVVVIFNETLAPYTAGNAPWTLANVPSGGTLGSVSVGSVSVAGSAATLNINEGVGAANTAVGSFTVALAGNANGIRDLVGNQTSFAATVPTDAADPVLTALELRDNNANGKVDQVFGTFTEALAASTDATPWTLGGAIPSSGITSSVSASGTNATLLITEGAGPADTAVGSLTVALGAAATGIHDAAGNQSSFGAQAPADKAAPLRLTLELRDSDTNGKVDRIVAIYTETLASSTDNALWTFGGAVPSGGTKGALSTTGSTSTLLITEGAGAADTAVGTLTIALAAGATGIRDPAGNQISWGSTAPADEAAPITVSMAISNNNATVASGDSITVVYSEPVATLCSAWGANSLTTNQSTTGLTGNFTNANPDTYTVNNCNGFGTLRLPGNNWTTTARTIMTTANWTVGTRTLVLTFTSNPSGTVSNQPETKTYSPGTLADGATKAVNVAGPTVSGGF